MNKLADIFLYPVKWFERLTDNKAALALGIIMVGLFDFFLPDIPAVYSSYFATVAGKSAGDIYINMFLAAIAILLFGLVDVFLFSVPLFDLLKFFVKREASIQQTTEISASIKVEDALYAKGTSTSLNRTSVTKVMKVYIMSHFIMIPLNVTFYYLVFKGLTEKSPLAMIMLAEVAIFILMIWSAAIIARGINSLFKPLLFKRFTFLIVFIWSFIFSFAIELIFKWFLQLFR